MTAIRYSLLTTLGAVLLLSTCLRGDTIAFTYNGNTTLDGGDTSTGTGSITFTPVSGAISLAQVTAFSYTQVTDLGINFTFGLPDLTTFTLTSASPTATINLVTAFVPPAAAGPLPENFTWTGPLTASTGTVAAQQPPPAGSFPVDTGPVQATYTPSVSVIPEPGTAHLLFAFLPAALAVSWARASFSRKRGRYIPLS